MGVRKPSSKFESLTCGNYNDRLPDGVEFVGSDHDDIRLRVSMPSDEDGHLGRQCPECSGIWRMHAEDYKALPDDPRLWCVYCGHEDDHSQFITKQQLDRAVRAAGDIGRQLVQEALDSAFRPLRRSSRSSFISIEYRSKPFYPAPLPRRSSTRYAVFWGAPVLPRMWPAVSRRCGV